MPCVFADVSTVFIRLREIECVQTGLQEQLEKLQSRIDALTANRAPDRLSNTPADRITIGASIIPTVLPTVSHADQISNGETVLPTVKPTGTIREDLNKPLPPYSSLMTSTPVTKAISTPAGENIITQANKVITAPVTEAMCTPVTGKISTPVTDATSAPVTKTISTGIAEAISAPVTEAKPTPIAEAISTLVTEAISTPQTTKTIHNITQQAAPLILSDMGGRIDDTTKPQEQQERDALFTEKTGGMDGSCTSKTR